MKMKAPDWMEKDDLISGGYMGLLKAAQKYHSGRGTKFSTFATYHIYWGIQDEIRRCSYVDRSSSPPKFAEVKYAEEMEDDRVVDPADVVDNERVATVATHIMNDIGGNERKCLALRYFFDKTFLEIGNELGMTESGAHQLHKRALAQCRFLIPNYAWVLK